jgi:hypothetical protein
MAVKTRAQLLAGIQATDPAEQQRDIIDSAAVGAEQTAVANASTAHALNSTFSDTEVEAALNALGTKLNSVLAALRAFDIIAES